MKQQGCILSAVFASVVLLLCLPSPVAMAQERITVSGTVVDDEGLPAISAAVLVKGRPSEGVTTDSKGRFRISITPGSVLQVSYVGYQSEEKQFKAASDWFVTLIPDAEMLDDVVVVGYGTQEKQSVVGAISTVSSERVNNTGTNSLTSALTGKVAGLMTSTVNGAPGEDETNLLLRGLSSWNGSAPLVMVDGVERRMSDVNPNEVKSISVLKDASATAVFGAKGANGVILVTTKTGQTGRPKIHVSLEGGIKNPVRLQEHVPSVTTVEMANVAMKNDRSFGSLYSAAVIEKYRNQSDPYRYPDVDWYSEVFRAAAPTVNASFDISGGNDRVKYYSAVTYYHEDSILKNLSGVSRSNYASDRINYRLNMDVNVTKTTNLALRLGGVITINRAVTTSGTTVNTGQIFNTVYMATGAVYPAYFPSDIYAEYPDPNYPDASEDRLASSAGSNFQNPMVYLMTPSWLQETTNRLSTDLVLKQKLDFITKGLSARLTASMTSTYNRKSQYSSTTIPSWSIDWNRYDLGESDIWNTSSTDASSVYVQNPLAEAQSTAASNVAFIFYLEGALDYKRNFGKHAVTATALYNQRQYNSGAASPKRNQSVVGRVTYSYAKKYLAEINAGVTGSEQFAPKYRYGFFPSVAIGYVASNEKFWKRAMPWWSTMKLRFSWGLVGSDSAAANFLYYSAYTYTKYTDADKIARWHYIEGAAANDGARWETADKMDLGIEMGWFKNALTLNIDLFNEYRYDMLLKPVTTPLLGVSFKDTNSGAMKKHGIDIELAWRKIHANSFTYEIGLMASLNENRIVKYSDIPYNPEYKKLAGTAYGSQNTGSTLVDDRYFQTIDEIHGYPTYTSSWNNIVPGVYKFLDYYCDGAITDKDLHTILGSAYPPCIYSINLGIGYKGFTARAVFAGTIGKYVEFKRSYMVPFISGDLSVHKAQLDYWAPDNRNASAPALSYSDQMYSWAGGTSTYPGYDLALEGYTWRRSDYFDMKELYLGYTLSNRFLQHRAGIESLTLSLICNNLFSVSGLIEGNPQQTNTASSYYPLMRTVKLGLSINFR